MQSYIALIPALATASVVLVYTFEQLRVDLGKRRRKSRRA
jgi:hypothetical protein